MLGVYFGGFGSLGSWAFGGFRALKLDWFRARVLGRGGSALEKNLMPLTKK